jgi:tetrahydrodipicolinate N-succinyltransferase
VYFTSQYDLSRLNHRFDSKQLVTTTGHASKKIEDSTFDELRRLEVKLERAATFSQKDMNKLFQLMQNVIDMGKRVNTPRVYWYSRQG